MLFRLLALICALWIALPAPALWAKNSHGRPDSLTEMGAWTGDFQVPTVMVDECPAVTPVASLVIAAFPCASYARGSAVPNGNKDLVYIQQDSIAFGPFDDGDGIYWGLMYRSSSTTPSGWHRTVGNVSHYVWKKVDTQPDDPLGGIVFLKVIVQGGVITSVTVLPRGGGGGGGGGGNLGWVVLNCKGTDDTAHVQAALTSLQGTGGTVYHPGPTTVNPGGECVINGTSRVGYESTKPITLRGMGAASIFRWNSPADSDCKEFGGCEFDYFPAGTRLRDYGMINLHGPRPIVDLGPAEGTLDGILVEDLTIDCGGAGMPSYPFTHPTSPWLDNLDARQRCLSIYWAANIVVRHNTVKNANAEMIYINAFGDGNVDPSTFHHGIVSENHLINGTHDAINDISTFSIVTGNFIERFYAGVEGCRDDCIITSNRFENIIGPAVFPSGSTMDISDNIMRNCGQLDGSGNATSGAIVLAANRVPVQDVIHMSITGNNIYFDNVCADDGTGFHCSFPVSPHPGTSVGINTIVGEPDHTKMPKKITIANNIITGYSIGINAYMGQYLFITGNQCLPSLAVEPQRCVKVIGADADFLARRGVVWGNSFWGTTTSTPIIYSDDSLKPNDFDLHIDQNWANGALVDGVGNTPDVVDNTTTPLLRRWGHGHVFSLSSAGAQNRTDFPGWNDNDRIAIYYADGNQRIVQGAPINTIDSKSWTAPIGSVSIFEHLSGRWFEVSRVLPVGGNLCFTISGTTSTLDLTAGAPGNCFYITNSSPTTINKITLPSPAGPPLSLYFTDGNTTFCHTVTGSDCVAGANINLLFNANFNPNTADVMVFQAFDNVAKQIAGYCNITSSHGCQHSRISFSTLNAATMIPGNSGYCYDCTVATDPCTGGGGGTLFVVKESAAKRCF